MQPAEGLCLLGRPAKLSDFWLLAGRIPFASQQEWHDGRPAHVVVAMHTLDLGFVADDEECPAHIAEPSSSPGDEEPQ